MVPRENKNNAYVKIWGQTKSIMVFSEVAYCYCWGNKQIVLWYFLKWPIYIVIIEKIEGTQPG